MYRIRTTKTSSGATAVQVVSYSNNRKNIASHIGSSRDKDELRKLKESALIWIEKNDPQQSLFPITKSKEKQSSLISLEKCRYLGFRYSLLYDTLWNITIKFKFHLLEDSKILNDLVVTRIIHPASKLESFEFIKDYFGIKHNRTIFYRDLTNFDYWRHKIEAKIINIAKKHFSFNFSLIFYDLTTLYFESFDTDDIRKIGFSKDNKASQPQITLGLLVNNHGFPISYQLFPGNKFEGHTLIPSILSLKKKYKIKDTDITIVADSAMISQENITFLKMNKLNYIVAARTTNLPQPVVERISKELNQKDEKTMRIDLSKQDYSKSDSNKGYLICHFSKTRYQKEKREMEKQINRANHILQNKDKVEIIKRSKFVTSKNSDYQLNEKLINKTKLLLGIKTYYTNQPEDKVSNIEVIREYKNLWHVEKAFRISKSDLKARPIFHSTKQSIEVHILICFMALAIAKFIEIKTGKSIKFFVKELKKVTDARIFDELNNREVVMRSQMSDEVKEIIEKLR